MPAELNRAAKLASLGDRPLAVVTAGEGYAAEWPGQQDDLATLSSNSVHRIVAGSTHASLVDDESDAAQSSRAIRDVVNAVRVGRLMNAGQQRPDPDLQRASTGARPKERG